jgi:hypothetical protein
VKKCTEFVVEDDATLDRLADLGYEVFIGAGDRTWRDRGGAFGLQAVFLFDRLQIKLEELNPKIPLAAFPVVLD